MQVKTIAGDGPRLRFETRTHDTESYIGAVEWLAFHSTHHRVTAWLKPEEVGVRPTLLFGAGKPRQANQRKASDYPIERVIKETDT